MFTIYTLKSETTFRMIQGRVYVLICNGILVFYQNENEKVLNNWMKAEILLILDINYLEYLFWWGLLVSGLAIGNTNQ